MIKIVNRQCLLFALIFLCFQAVGAELSKVEQLMIYNKTKQLMTQNFIFPERVEGCMDKMRLELDSARYVNLMDRSEFITAFNKSLKRICEDKHFWLSVRVKRDDNKMPLSPFMQQQLEFNNQRADNFGVNKVEMLADSIGYIKLDYFREPAHSSQVWLSAVDLIRHGKALIMDLRENHGGRPEMVALISSYFLAKPTHLVTFFERGDKVGQQSWSFAEVPGEKIADMPLYILVGPQTGSAGEGFSYHMKHLKRATLIGESTYGAGNPGSNYSINDDWQIFIADGRPENAITGKNWEGQGVIPNIKVNANEAIKTAIRQANIDIPNRLLSESFGKAELALLDQIAEARMKGLRDKVLPLLYQVVQENPKSALTWQSIGYEHQRNKEYKKSLEAYKQAKKFLQTRVFAYYQSGAILSLQNKPEQAFEQLFQAKEMGFSNIMSFRMDTDFNNIKNDVRFETLLN